MVKLILIAVSFWLGSIPFGILVVRLLGGPDPRTVGSGNIGATNVARAAGLKAGILTLMLDASKGAIPVLVATHMVKDPYLGVWCGFAAIIGHCLSPFLGFNGGKGVATGAGVFAAIAPKAFIMAFIVFAVVFCISRIVSLSSISSAASMPIFVYLSEHDLRKALITLAISLFIIYRHRENIHRLMRGEERRFSPGRS